MNENARHPGLEALEPLVGEWRVEASFEEAPPGRSVYEWILGGRFLVERSEFPHPAAPDGFSIIAFDEEHDAYRQHYFDSRGVVRIYGMTFADHVWKRWRDSPDFSPLNFWQRFEGTFSDDGNVIAARWETSSDEGASWELDFRLTYTKVS